MKKIILSLPFLTLSLLFTYCDKASVQDSVAATNPNAAAASRGDCKLEVWTDSENSVQICGTETNIQSCTSCDPSVSYNGVEIVSGGFGSFNVTSPLKLAVTNIAATATYINLVSPTSGSSTGFILFQPGECREFFLDDNCNIQ